MYRKEPIRPWQFVALRFFLQVESSPFTLRDDGSLQVAADLRVYGQEALLKAAHRFTDRCHLHLQTRDEHTVLVYFRAKEGKVENLREMAGEFFNELLDQRLRSLAQRESEPVRNLILAHALSRTSLLGNADENPPDSVIITGLPSTEISSAA